MGAERIIAMSQQESQQKPTGNYGATDIVTERGDRGRRRDQGTDSGNRRRFGAGVRSARRESMQQAIQATRPGGFLRYISVYRMRRVELDGRGAVLRSQSTCMAVPRRCAATFPI